MIKFNEDGFTIDVKTGINPIEAWQELHHDLIDILISLNPDMTIGCTHRPVLILLQEMIPDIKMILKTQSDSTH